MDCCENIISFCTGAGGIELGLHRVSDCFRTVCYVEIELYAIANLVAKIEENKLDAAPIWTDLKTFPAKQFSGKIHGITAGFPCQPFSNAGNKMGTEDPRHLWPYIEKSIDVIRPGWVFLENVPGLISTYTIHHRPKWQKYCQRAAERLGAGHAQRFAAKLARHGGISAFRFIAWRLEQMGYRIEAGLFTASEVGVPHKRERLFILAIAVGKRAGCEGGQTGRGNRGSVLRQGNGQACAGGVAAAGELAVAAGKRTQRHEPAGDNQPERPIDELRNDRWPARPGQEQCDWEEPRTVKSGMGRTVDGFASRVDELRLLGNGVVPQCVELAFRTLWEKMGLKL